MRFARFVNEARAAGELIVQPRMGFGTPRQMRAGLVAVRAARAKTVGTITLDSYTRVGDQRSALLALVEGRDLNGYPIVALDREVTRGVVRSLQSGAFPIQVRHGSAKPYQIFEALRDCGLDATEGGPVSYCLPYGRTPLAEAVDEWRRCSDLVAEAVTADSGIHLETFGGCMLGQMCPPSLLVALSVLEAMFFRQRGVQSVSLSYAQQTCRGQDVAALHALRHLAGRFLPRTDWHVVLYTYMGVFPRSRGGALDLIGDSVHLAKAGAVERLIVKTVAEAHRIPTIAENVEALEFAARTWRGLSAPAEIRHAPPPDHDVLAEATTLVEATLELAEDIGNALLMAFKEGLLDVPFCLHADNAGQSRTCVGPDGSLQWLDPGRMPVRRLVSNSTPQRLDPKTFVDMLSIVSRRFDKPYLDIEESGDVTHFVEPRPVPNPVN